MRILRQQHIVNIYSPDDINGESGDAVTEGLKMNLYEHIALLFQIGDIAAAMTATIQQDTQVAGSAADKPLNFEEYWTQDVGSSPDTWTRTKLSTPANTLAIAATDDNKNFLIEISSKQLDATNEFDILKVTLGADSAAACEVAVIALCQRARYAHDGMPGVTS